MKTFLYVQAISHQYEKMTGILRLQNLQVFLFRSTVSKTILSKEQKH